GAGEDVVRGGLIVESAVGLDVRQLRAVGTREGQERAYLIEHVGPDLVGARPARPAPEPAQVREAGVRPDRDARAYREVHSALHDAGVAGVEAAGDVGRA